MAGRSECQGGTIASLTPLTAAQRRALAGLSRAGLLDGLYLAGGAAVAHHLGDRRSNDLDLFVGDPAVDLDDLRRRALAALAGATTAQTESTLALRRAGTMVDVVRFPYPLLGRVKPGPSGVLVASLRDLAAMKLAAIAKRGVRRDYSDLFEMLTRTGLTIHRPCDDYLRKHGVSEADLYHVLRALVWFEDPMRIRHLHEGSRARRGAGSARGSSSKPRWSFVAKARHCDRVGGRRHGVVQIRSGCGALGQHAHLTAVVGHQHDVLLGRGLELRSKGTEPR